jgi:hypothetical protein
MVRRDAGTALVTLGMIFMKIMAKDVNPTIVLVAAVDPSPVKWES